MLNRLAATLLLRRVLRDLTRIADSLATQTALLARLVDRFAPAFPSEPSPGDRATLRTDTGVSHLDQDDASAALAYIARMEAATGHTPDEDEILIHLADEKTRDLQQRLLDRDDELARLMEARR